MKRIMFWFFKFSVVNMCNFVILFNSFYFFHCWSYSPPQTDGPSLFVSVAAYRYFYIFSSSNLLRTIVYKVFDVTTLSRKNLKQVSLVYEQLFINYIYFFCVVILAKSWMFKNKIKKNHEVQYSPSLWIFSTYFIWESTVT